MNEAVKTRWCFGVLKIATPPKVRSPFQRPQERGERYSLYSPFWYMHGICVFGMFVLHDMSIWLLFSFFWGEKI